MKILSWNIWIDCHFNELENFLSATDADIIGLQEVKDDDAERDVIGLLTKLGYEHFFAKTEQVWDGKVYRHGPAIFSKFPIKEAEKIQLESGDDERAVAYAQIDVNGSTVHVFSAHLIHTHQQHSAAQETQTQKIIDRLPNNRVIVMGDFNATPESASVQNMEKFLQNTYPNNQPTWSVYPEGCHKCNPQASDQQSEVCNHKFSPDPN